MECGMESIKFSLPRFIAGFFIFAASGLLGNNINPILLAILTSIMP